MQTQVEMEMTTAPQWKAALEKANELRGARAQYKRDMKSGEVTSRELLLDPPELALDVKIVDILQWIPGVKRKRALQVMAGIIYQEGMPLRRLSLSTRRKLYDQVEHYRPGNGDRMP